MDMIQINRTNFKVLDLRWNELGEIGAQNILAALPENQYLKFIGLEDNQISTGILMQIDATLKKKVLKPNNSLPNAHFPLSMDEYPSMDVQLKTG